MDWQLDTVGATNSCFASQCPKNQCECGDFVSDHPTMPGITPTMLGITPTVLGTTPTMPGTTPTMLGISPTVLGTTLINVCCIQTEPLVVDGSHNP